MKNLSPRHRSCCHRAHEMTEFVLFPSVPPKFCKNIAIRWRNCLQRVVLSHNKACRGISDYWGGSLRCTHPACISLQPQRYTETDAVVGSDLPPNSALPISPQNALIPWNTYTASHRERLVPKPPGQPVWGCLRAASPLERQLTAGTAELSADQAGL